MKTHRRSTPASPPSSPPRATAEELLKTPAGAEAWAHALKEAESHLRTGREPVVELWSLSPSEWADKSPHQYRNQPATPSTMNVWAKVQRDGKTVSENVAAVDLLVERSGHWVAKSADQLVGELRQAIGRYIDYRRQKESNLLRADLFGIGAND